MAPFLLLIVAQGLAGLVKQATRKNMFSGIKVGGKKVEMNLLQFTNDTLFVYESKVQNIMCIKAILRCFELRFGLKVNFYKSKIDAIGVHRNEVKMYSEILHCSLIDIPFTYLGLTIRGNPSRCSFWEPISVWKGRNMSFAGRVCLIKSVINAIPLFFLSFLKPRLECVGRSQNYRESFCGGGKQKGEKSLGLAGRTFVKRKMRVD